MDIGSIFGGDSKAMLLVVFFILIWVFVDWLNKRPRAKALELLKVYAAQGREPPPEVLQLISAPRSDNWGLGDVGDWGFSSKGPFRKWENAIVGLGLAGGFGAAAWLNHAPFTHPFWVVAIVSGVLGLAAAVYAIITSLQRP
jgi:hypothetical protein